MSSPPVRTAPFSTSARTSWSVRTLIATDAPIPTVPPFASVAAFAVSLSLLFAVIETSPVPAVTDAPPVTIARVWLETRLSASAPAIPTFSLPAPDLATAETSCSASRKKSPSAGLAGKSSSVAMPPRFSSWRSHDDVLSTHL